MRLWLGLLALVVPFLLAPTEDATFQLEVTSASASLTAGFSITKATSCYSPCGVFVDAISDRASPDTAWDGSTDEFHEVTFEWDFGDADATTFSTTGHLQNEGIGPMGAHVYEIADGGGNQTFTITLTATAADGTTDTAQQTVNVLDPAGQTTTCISRTTNFDGCPTHASELTDTGSAETLIEARGGERILFHTGQTWTYANDIGPGNSTYIGSFGSGAQPILESTDTATNAKGFQTNGNSQIVAYDLELKGPGLASSAKPIMWDGADGSSNVLLHEITATADTWFKGLSMTSSTSSETGLILSESTLVGFASGGASSGGNIFYGEVRESAILGTRIGDNIGGEHVARFRHCPRSCLVDASEMGPADRAIITVRADDQSLSRQVQISRNKFRLGDVVGSAVGWIAKNNSEHTGVGGRDILAEGNLCIPDPVEAAAGTTASCIGAGGEDTQRQTVRNNMCRMDPSGWEGSCIQVKAAGTFANNVAFSDRSSGNSAHGTLDCNSGAGEARNNMLWSPNIDRDVIERGPCGSQSNNIDIDDLASNPFTSADPTDFADFQVTSPNATVIDAGYGDYATTPALPRLDAYGTDRPQGGGVDIGVHEQ